MPRLFYFSGTGNALMLAVLLLAYRVLHRAMRVPFVERLVVATSLTHFRFWRRYPAPRMDRR